LPGSPARNVDLRSTPGCATLKKEMSSSVPVPPGGGDVPDDDDLDDLEMTSVMDGAQARELQRAARLASEAEREAARLASEAEREGQRETARPPPAALVAVEAEVSIPRAPAVPVEALRTPEPMVAASAVSEVEAPAADGSVTWLVLAFVLLAAAIAFELR
jgi:hypothetical protein